MGLYSIYGAAGQVWTQAQQDKTTDEMAIQYGQRWVGHHVADCSGLFSWAFDKLGGYIPHGSNTIFRKYCTKTGTITKNTSLQPGTAVFKCRAGTRYDDKKYYYHMGLYIGNGTVIEAKGTRYGVVKSKLSEWHYWGLLKGISYDSENQKGDDDDMLNKGVAIVDVPNDGTVNVRSAPKSNADILTRLREGATVQVEEDSGEWAKVSYTNTGYIMSKFLRQGAD